MSSTCGALVTSTLIAERLAALGVDLADAVSLTPASLMSAQTTLAPSRAKMQRGGAADAARRAGDDDGLSVRNSPASSAWRVSPVRSVGYAPCWPAARSPATRGGVRLLLRRFRLVAGFSAGGGAVGAFRLARVGLLLVGLVALALSGGAGLGLGRLALAADAAGGSFRRRWREHLPSAAASRAGSGRTAPLPPRPSSRARPRSCPRFPIAAAALDRAAAPPAETGAGSGSARS